VQDYASAGAPVDVGAAASGGVADNRRILSGDINPGCKGCSAAGRLR
jgi:hypothetical protein